MASISTAVTTQQSYRKTCSGRNVNALTAAQTPVIITKRSPIKLQAPRVLDIIALSTFAKRLSY